MPAVSKKQYRFMATVEHGGIHVPGLSPQKAAEYVDTVNYRSLPDKKKKKNLGFNLKKDGNS